MLLDKPRKITISLKPRTNPYDPVVRGKVPGKNEYGESVIEIWVLYKSELERFKEVGLDIQEVF